MRPLLRARLGLALTLAALALLAGCGDSGEPPRAERPLIVQDDAELLYRDDARTAAAVASLKQAGVDWVRISAGWSFIAPTPTAPRRPAFDAADPDAYPPGAWTPLDRAVRLARAAGLEVMIDIAFWAPRWAVTRAVAPLERPRWGIDAVEFGRFAQAVARRYGDRARAYAIWNEPNYGVFLLPQWRTGPGGLQPASPDAYRAMLYAAAPVIRAAAPGALVLIGNTAPAGEARPTSVLESVPPLRFLRDLACVDGALRPVRTGACASFRPLPGDGWAHHPYPPRGAPPQTSDPDPDDVPVADLGRLTGLLTRLGRAGRTERTLPVYVTEFGYQTNPPNPTAPVTPAEQSRYTLAARDLAFADPAVRSFSQFLIRDLPENAGGFQFADGRPKPLFDALRRAADRG